MDALLNGFAVVTTPANLLYCFVGCLLGTIVGILPGLGPLTTIAILLPITFKMDVTSAIIMLSGIYYGVAYGGTVTSVLMRIPGEASSVVTCLDGYEMARKGRAGAALGIAAIGSFVAGTVGVLGISFLSPPLAKFVLSDYQAERINVELDANGVDPGIVVIDDKWQASYGDNEVDASKWPDLRGFVDRQHGRGRHVLLWLKAWDPEGVPVEECVRNAANRPTAVDPTNPAFVERLRAGVRRRRCLTA